jgi:hypothetical protein
MELPPDLSFRKDFSIILWKPRGTLNEAMVNEIVPFIEKAERRTIKPFNRFVDLSAIDMVDLNFRFVFQVALFRRLSVKSKPVVKAAFYITSKAAAHYPRLHALLTDFSPLDVSLFNNRAEAAKWLDVPVDVLTMS